MTLRASIALASTLTALGVLALTATPALAAPQTLKVSVTGSGQVNDSLGLIIGCEEAGGTCEAAYEEGATLILFASRDTHSRFAGWEGCPNVLSAGEYGTGECEVTLSAATEVKAKFTAIPQAELEVEVQGAGEVTSSPAGIACASGPCKEHFDTEGPEATVTLFATASPDNRFEKWEGACSGSGTCEVTMSAARSVKALFAPILHQLTLTPSGPGSVSATTPASGIANCSSGGGTCAASYQEASTVILTATPQPHNHVTWSGCVEVPNHPDECKITIGVSEAEVKAAFQVNTHTLAVTPTLLGSVSASAPPIAACSSGGGTCAGAYDEASTLTLTATPVAHYHSTGWEACPHELSAGECEITIGTSDALLKPLFAANLQTLTLTPTGPGSLRANSGAIVHCTAAGGTCAGPYIEAATVTLTASPGPGQAVAWQGCAALPSPNTCEVQIGASETSVKASFAPITHALTVAKAGSGQGQVTCNGAPCAAAYPDATALTLTASPAAGSTFAGWSGGGCSGTGTCHLTLQADTTITATFNANPPPPAEEKCVVPSLAGKALGQARSALAAAHCALGTVTKPKPKQGHKLGPLVVKSSSPTVGTTLPAAGKVDLILGPKPRKKH